MTLSLYAQALGGDFLQLDAPVRAFHGLQGQQVLPGVVRVDGPSSPLARRVARWLGAPTQRAQGPIRVEVEAAPQAESRTLHFPSGETMVSRLACQPSGIVKHLGPLRMVFALEAVDGRLLMHLRRMRVWGLPCPAWALPQVIAEESGRGGRLHFLVRAALPLVGQVVACTGYLELPSEEPVVTPA